jgi:hypothetical protein
LTPKQNCHPDRSVPGFPASRPLATTCAALLKDDHRTSLTHEWMKRSLVIHSSPHTNCVRVPLAPAPHQRSVFFSLLPSPLMIGCPILRALGEGWDKQNLRGRSSGAEPWYPTLRKKHEGWVTRALVMADGVFLLREPRVLTGNPGERSGGTCCLVLVRGSHTGS